jgi:hypothetical protein
MEFFIDINLSDYTMALGSTLPLNGNEYWEYFLGVNAGRCVKLTTLPPSCAVVKKSGNLNFLEHLGHPRSVTGLLYLQNYT